MSGWDLSSNKIKYFFALMCFNGHVILGIFISAVNICKARKYEENKKQKLTGNC